MSYLLLAIPKMTMTMISRSSPMTSILSEWLNGRHLVFPGGHERSMQRVLGVLLPSGAEGDPTGDDAHQQQARDGYTSN